MISHLNSGQNSGTCLNSGLNSVTNSAIWPGPYGEGALLQHLNTTACFWRHLANGTKACPHRSGHSSGFRGALWPYCLSKKFLQGIKMFVLALWIQTQAQVCKAQSLTRSSGLLFYYRKWSLHRSTLSVLLLWARDGITKVHDENKNRFSADQKKDEFTDEKNDWTHQCFVFLPVFYPFFTRIFFRRRKTCHFFRFLIRLFFRRCKTCYFFVFSSVFFSVGAKLVIFFVFSSVVHFRYPIPAVAALFWS